MGQSSAKLLGFTDLEGAWEEESRNRVVVEAVLVGQSPLPRGEDEAALRQGGSLFGIVDRHACG